MRIYGREFAAAYNDHWGWWSAKVWPFLREAVSSGKTSSRTWLDLCCGAGSLLQYVCRAGFSAVGLDRSPHQLRYAERNAPRARLVRADVREFRLNRKFDVVSCMFDSLNYLTVTRDLARVFRNARRHLGDHGHFVFDMNTFEGLQDNWCRTSTMRDRSRMLIIESSFNPKTARGCCVITGFARTGRLYRKFEETHTERGYRAAEIESLLEGARFRFRKYDAYSLGRPKKRSGRLLYVCRPES
jgi:SAM-dependent methyltransferase